jgi:hypothetical protein
LAVGGVQVGAGAQQVLRHSHGSAHSTALEQHSVQVLPQQPCGFGGC